MVSAWLPPRIVVPGGMGGQEALAVLRPSFPQLRAIAMSGYGEDPVIANPSRFGFDTSLRKPFSRDELMRVVVGEGAAPTFERKGD